MYRNGREIFNATRARGARAPDTAELPRFVDHVFDERPAYRARSRAIRRIQWEAAGQIALIAAVIGVLAFATLGPLVTP